VKITEQEVHSVAEIARLELTQEEGQKITHALQVILEQTEALKRLEISKVKPTVYVLPLQNVFSEDQLDKCLTQEQALGNAPEVEKGCFKVPRII